VTTRRNLLTLAGAAALPAIHAAPSASTGGRKVLRFALSAAEIGFDPAQIQDTYSRLVTAHILEAPLAYEYYARPARLRLNTLAAMPEVSSDFRTFVFRFRPGILFADDPAFGGKPRELVAADYAYSWKRLYDPRWKSPMLFTLENNRVSGLSELRQQALKSKQAFDYDRPVEGLRALDRYTLQVRLDAPSPRLLWYFADSSVYGAVAREVVERYGDDIAAHPVGTGPFRLVQWRRASFFALERNPGYRPTYHDEEPPADDAAVAAEVATLKGKRLPLVDRVELSIIEEPQPRWLSFLGEEQDMLWRLPTAYANLAVPGGRLAPHLGRRGIKLARMAESATTLTYFNMDDPVVGGYAPAQVALRRAVNLAVDIGQEIALARQGQAIPAQTPIPPSTYAYDPELRTEMGEFDRSRARALLDLHGYVDRDGDGWRERPDGSPLVLELSSMPNQTDRKLAELWESNMRAIGIRLKLNVANWPELLRQSLAGKLMMWGWTWQAGPDSDSFIGLGYGPNRGQLNDARFDLPAYNALYERQKVLPDGPERLAAIRDAMKLLVAYAPYKFHVHRIENDLMHPWVVGYRRHPFTNRFFHLVDIDPTLRGAGVS
jgi:ABC-type transport system substrate-binding protein